MPVGLVSVSVHYLNHVCSLCAVVRVIIDTNFLLLPYQEGIDVFTQMAQVVDGKPEFCIIDKTRQEIDHLMRTGSLKDRMAARLGHSFVTQFLGMKRLKIIHTLFAKDVDAALLQKAGKSDYVATMDRELKAKLKNQGVKVLTLRGNHVVVEHK